jgi:hypothetical protein
MPRSCHFDRFDTREGYRNTLADPERVSVGSPTRPDRGKTVVTLMTRPFCPFFERTSPLVTRECEQRLKAVLPEMTLERHVFLLAVRRVFR